MVLGPPRSGKTSAVMIPALMAAPGAALSTSTKTDVMSATLAARSEIGQAWLFDPSGERDDAEMFGENVRRLQWSPVAAARTWDQALMTARAMAACTRAGSGTTNENHWTERAGALLAPLLYAANWADRPIGEVLRWTLRQDLAPARAILSDADAQVANTAPIHDLPASISQAGGQGLQVMIGLQDLSQARTRWGDAQADGLLSLFQTKLILTGIADTRTLEAISISLGEYDRQTVSQSIGVAEPQEWFATPTRSETITYNTQRQRVLTPGEVANLPYGQGLLLEGANWRTIRLTPWFENEPWRRIGARGGLR